MQEEKKFKKFIFLSHEGKTFAPHNNIEINNLQVIGIVEKVSDENEGYKKLLIENPWIWDSGFNVAEFIIYEII